MRACRVCCGKTALALCRLQIVEAGLVLCMVCCVIHELCTEPGQPYHMCMVLPLKPEGLMQAVANTNTGSNEKASN